MRAFNDWYAAQPEADQAGLLLLVSGPAAECMVWLAGPETEFLRRIWEQARSLGVCLEVHQAHWDQRDMRRALGLLSAERARLRDQFGFELWGIKLPTAGFIGLTLRGIALGNEQSDQLPPELIDAVREEIAELLRDTPIGRDEVRIEYGQRSAPLSEAQPQPSA